MFEVTVVMLKPKPYVYPSQWSKALKTRSENVCERKVQGDEPPRWGSAVLLLDGSDVPSLTQYLQQSSGSLCHTHLHMHYTYKRCTHYIHTHIYIYIYYICTYSTYKHTKLPYFIFCCTFHMQCFL